MTPGGSKIDWQAVREELSWDDRDRQQQVRRERLHQRARQYASLISDRDDQTRDSRTMMTFRLDQEFYAIDAIQVQTVRPVSRITAVPSTPAFYRGVVNVRGQIISVLDLRMFFGMAADEEDPPKELIVVKVNNLELGLLAHHVHDVIEIPLDSLQPLEDIKYAIGMNPDRVMLIDIARLFEDERLIIGSTEE